MLRRGLARRGCVRCEETVPSAMLRNDGGDDVYPASEDTHLLIDALMSESSQFVARGASACLCLELGYVSLLVPDIAL